jgi:hypothetical protein
VPRAGAPRIRDARRPAAVLQLAWIAAAGTSDDGVRLAGIVCYRPCMTTWLRIAFAVVLAVGLPIAVAAADMEIGGRPDTNAEQGDMEADTPPQADMEVPADMEATNTPPAGFQHSDDDQENDWQDELE